MIKNNIDFKKFHNLDYLLQLCINKDSEFSDLKLDDLQNYAVQIRYPDEFYILTLEEATKSYKVMDKIKNLIYKKLCITDSDIKDDK